ncbi:hypothetical protein [Streptomyces sp. EN16]|nr:hypothetical protein [Streptomyces sp. EN16]
MRGAPSARRVTNWASTLDAELGAGVDVGMIGVLAVVPCVLPEAT